MEIIGSKQYYIAFSERERRFKEIALRVQPRLPDWFFTYLYIYIYIYLDDEHNKSDRVINYKKNIKFFY